MPTPAPRRLLLSQLNDIQTPCPVRVVGVAVRIASDFIILDDGSQKVKLLCPRHDTSPGALGDVIMVLADWTGEELHASTIIWKTDCNIEALQWQEALYSGPAKNGFPFLPVDKAEVLRFISLEAGISMEDLALVLKLKQNEMNTIIQQLQEEGSIYLNRQGQYVPL